MATTSSERGLTLRSPGRFSATAQRLESLYQSSADDPLLDARVLEAALKAESYRLFTDASVTAMNEGQPLGARSSLMKVFWSELDIDMHETALALLGDDAALESPWTKGFQFSLGGPIYAGTIEIQRNIIAERVLGLPRK